MNTTTKHKNLLALAKKLANKYKRHNDWDTALSDACFGIALALQEWDSSSGVPFSVVAARRTQDAMDATRRQYRRWRRAANARIRMVSHPETDLVDAQIDADTILSRLDRAGQETLKIIMKENFYVSRVARQLSLGQTTVWARAARAIKRARRSLGIDQSLPIALSGFVSTRKTE